jgi:hypothetical protein
MIEKIRMFDIKKAAGNEAYEKGSFDVFFFTCNIFLFFYRKL